LRTKIFRHGRGVDWITQAALGATIGELLMGKRLGKQALAWGALFGLLPYLEGLITPWIDTARGLAVKGGMGHSLLIMVAGSCGVARGMAVLWRREKISRQTIGVWVFVTWAAHVLVDSFSVDGVALGWPLFSTRLSLNLLSPEDFVVAVPLVVAVAVGSWGREATLKKPAGKKPRGKKSQVKHPPLASKRRKWCGWGLGLSSGYVLLVVALKFWVSTGFEADLARRGVLFQRRMEAPTAYNFLLWRSVVDSGGEFRVGYRSVFEGRDTPVRWTIYPQHAEALREVKEARETRTLQSITDGWWIARPYAKGAWLGDLRQPEDRRWNPKKSWVDGRVVVSWIILPPEKSDRLRRMIPKTEGEDYFDRLWRRAMGDQGGWEASPRLVGVPGNLPEFLITDD
jgi:inner membrane protein